VQIAHNVLVRAIRQAERERRAGHRARYRLVDAQNARFGAASMVMGTAHHNVPNSGRISLVKRAQGS